MYKPKDGDIVVIAPLVEGGNPDLVALCDGLCSGGKHDEPRWTMADWPNYNATVGFDMDEDLPRVIGVVKEVVRR